MANPAKEAIAKAPIVSAPSPIPIAHDLAEPAPFPIDSLPPDLRDAVLALEDITQAPQALCANSVLAVAAYVAQTEADIRHPGTKQAVVLSLFLLTIAQSGERKSAVDSLATNGLWQYQSVLQETFDTANADFQKDRSAYESLTKSISRSIKSKTMDAIRQAREDIGEEPIPPLRPEVFASEPTVEGLLKSLFEGTGSIAMFSDEGGQILGGHAMSDDNKLKTSAALSGLWNASPVTRIRAGSENQTIQNKRVSAHLMVQPEVGLATHRDKVMRDQGILSRFLTSYPESKVGNRPFKEASKGALKIIETFSEKICERLRQPKSLKNGKANEFDLPLLEVSEEALAVWAEFHDEVESNSGKFGRYEHIAGFANKSGEHALRLAGVLAIFENPGLTEVSKDQMEDGIDLCRFYLDEILRISEAAVMTVQQKDALQLLEWLQERLEPGQEFSFRWINQCGPKSTRTASKARNALKLLTENGWVRLLENGATINGEFASEAYAIMHGT